MTCAFVDFIFDSVCGYHFDKNVNDFGAFFTWCDAVPGMCFMLFIHDMSRLDAVNYISHGIAKVPGYSQAKAADGVDNDAQEEKVVRKGSDALDAYCINLNKKAKDGKIDPLIGRESEIERTIQVLCRRQKNNPLYVGDPGVGKTAIAEGLAKRIVEGDVPEVLLKSTIFALDMGSLLAGTRYRGDFEERVKLVIDRLSTEPGAILFELAGVPLSIAKEAFRLADAKLPFHCRFVAREGAES